MSEHTAGFLARLLSMIRPSAAGEAIATNEPSVPRLLLTPLSIEELVQAMLENDITTPQRLRGCSPDEIRLLEEKYRITLPPTYRKFLEVMGHDSGLLFRWDHLGETYEYVWRLTEEERERRREESIEDLPDDAFIICGRLGEQFELLRCDVSDASAIWYFDETDPFPRLAYPSCIHWLNAQYEGACAAKAQGYFEMYPNGTEP